ncbi:MAG: hypothetical protein AAF821_13470 [Cyanobacteria bacterium P01_D01_bin.156]
MTDIKWWLLKAEATLRIGRAKARLSAGKNYQSQFKIDDFNIETHFKSTSLILSLAFLVWQLVEQSLVFLAGGTRWGDFLSMGLF